MMSSARFVYSDYMFKSKYDPAVIATVGAVFFAFSLFAFLFSFPPQRAAAEGVAPAAPAEGSTPLRPLEMHIANNGLVLLRSAKVVSVQGNTIMVSTAWGSADFTWTVRTDTSHFETRSFGTRFIDRDGKKGSLSGINVGSVVTITGALDPTAGEPTIDADSVRLLK